LLNRVKSLDKIFFHAIIIAEINKKSRSNFMKLSEKIKHYRIEHELTQQEFADRGQLTRAVIEAIENERIENPGMDTLIGIAKAMETGLDELVKE
jgi:DNA-binding XRE family transcriptional regulator